ncbi:hypothetical protein IAU60_005452 [Kwoniella sp. DSM 27419]
MPPPSTIPPSKKRKTGPTPIAPRPLLNHAQGSSPTASLSSLEPEADDDYMPSAANVGGAPRSSTRNGSTKRKSTASTPSGPVSGARPTKMSREALRKANHSLIERRRREKINAALAELRQMVPGLGEEGGGKGGEFKLEVLERTVEHMKELKNHIRLLEETIASHGIHVESLGNGEDGGDEGDQGARLDDSAEHVGGMAAASRTSEGQPTEATHDPRYSHPSTSQSYRKTHPHLHPHASRHGDSPYPSPSPDAQDHGLLPDPNETEAESDLPRPLAKAHPRPRVPAKDGPLSRSSSGSGSPPIPQMGQAPSVASLLASADHHRHSPSPTLSRPPPPAQANNPIFLPFPAPSPTSPFMNAGGGSAASSASAATSTTGPPDPSPFLAPMSGMSLFGGVISLDPTSPVDPYRPGGGYFTGYPSKQPSPPHLALPPTKPISAKDMPPEEAANLLLAFSSPDTLRPQLGVPERPGGGRMRRLTLDSDEFVLDAGDGGGARGAEVVGKSARDILRMAEVQR